MDPIKFKQFCDFYYWFLKNHTDVFYELRDQHPDEAWDEALKLVISFFTEFKQEEKAEYLRTLLKEEQEQNFEFKPEDFNAIGAISKKLIG
jgi:hypothetical protein